MNEDRKRILAMLAERKITADEAERLLDAMGREPAPRVGSAPTNGASSLPKYFRVEVNANEPGDTPTKVNVRVPMQLLRAGVRLGALIPPLKLLRELRGADHRGAVERGRRASLHHNGLEIAHRRGFDGGVTGVGRCRRRRGGL